MCGVLCSCSEHEAKGQVLAKLPASVNSDLFFLLDTLLTEHDKEMSWREIGLCLQSVGEASGLFQAEDKPEIIWTGPATETFPVRRIDQVLYDLIQKAQESILLVTFAAAKIDRLCRSLLDSSSRGVNVGLILEFEEESQGQLSIDSLKAFPENLTKKIDIYYWPIEKRECNELGRPGKLHAKCAVIDDNAIISSANLTDDAFNRNMEMGVLLRGGILPRQLREYFRGLISKGVFCKFPT